MLHLDRHEECLDAPRSSIGSPVDSQNVGRCLGSRFWTTRNAALSVAPSGYRLVEHHYSCPTQGYGSTLHGRKIAISAFCGLNRTQWHLELDRVRRDLLPGLKNRDAWEIYHVGSSALSLLCLPISR